MNKHELLDRLIDFAVEVINLTNYLKPRKASSILEEQIIRSGNSPALNYSEAIDAESTNDFIHKLKICLKELRESQTSAKIIDRSMLCTNQELLNKILSESNELISIFVASIKNLRLKS